MSNDYVNFWADTDNKFVSSKAQDNTLYFITDKGKLYKGQTLIAEVNVDTIGRNVIGVKDATSNSAQANGNVYLTHTDGDAKESSHLITGSGKVSVASDKDGNITITGSATTVEELGLTNAMHYLGTSTEIITDGGTQKPKINGDFVDPKAGDVVLYYEQEYVYNSAGKWELLGDEGSYLLKSKVDTSVLAGTGVSNTANTTQIYRVQEDKGGKLAVHVPWTDNDTKNTAGSTNSSSKLFLIGATSQAANPQTYSHDTAYVGTDGALYSEGAKVATQTWSNGQYVNTTGDTMTGALKINAGNPHVYFKDTGYSTDWYIQAYQDQFGFGTTWTTAFKSDKNGNVAAAGTVTVGSKATLQYDSTNECLNFTFS